MDDIDKLDAIGKAFWYGFVPIAMLVLIFGGGYWFKLADERARKAERERLQQEQLGSQGEQPL